MRIRYAALVMVLACGAVAGRATTVLQFGDADCLGEGCYGATNPTAGATLQGLAAGVVTKATTAYPHVYPFSPGAGEFAGTDQIFVGSSKTASHDGYSVSPNTAGPQVLTLDYSSLLNPGDTLASLTLGIAADDFQFLAFGQPFIATLNGSTNAALTAALNSLNQSGPFVQFLTIGLDPSIDSGSHVLHLSINEGGDGGDGWAVDFLTVGVTTTSALVPEPASVALLGLGAGLAFLTFRRRRKTS